MKIIRKIFLVLSILYVIVCLSACFLQEKLLFFPEKLQADYKFQFDYPFEERNLACPTGDTLNELVFKTDSSKGMVLYFHGNAGSLRTWGSVAGRFLKNKYDVTVIDYQKYGKSRGKFSEKNFFDDAQAVFNDVKNNYKESNIVVYGRSLGTGIAAYIASENKPGKLVLEAPYYSLKDVAHHIYPFLPTFILKYPFRTDLFIQKVKCPIYIFHGTDDEVIYYDSSLKLKKYFSSDDTLFTIAGGHHNDLSKFDSYNFNLNKILE
jgi:fermentation-respiration switch protein FrsA (DUF1100 family)